MKKALKAWRDRILLVHACKEMGMLRQRRAVQEQAALCFTLWRNGAAQQRLAASQVGLESIVSCSLWCEGLWSSHLVLSYIIILTRHG